MNTLLTGNVLQSNSINNDYEISLDVSIKSVRLLIKIINKLIKFECSFNLIRKIHY